MTEKAKANANDIFYQFLHKDGPRNKKECTLYQSSDGNFYLVVGGRTGNDRMMYVINGHFWYDWTEEFINDNQDWKVLYKKVAE